MATFHISIVAPDRSIAEAEAASAVLPGVNGYLGVMAGHAPLIGTLRAGIVEYTDAANQRHHVYVGGGFAEIRDNKLIVLADEAAFAKELTVAEAEAALEDARRALRGEASGTVSTDAVEEMERAMQRLRAARMSG